MVTHSSIFAWEIPWTGEPGGMHSMGSQKSRLNRQPPPHMLYGEYHISEARFKNKVDCLSYRHKRFYRYDKSSNIINEYYTLMYYEV